MGCGLARIGTAGDGGGGVFYWSTTAEPDDGWSVLNAGSGNLAGWRRVKQRPVLESILRSSLSARSGVTTGEVVATIGDSANDDGLRDDFRWLGAAGTTDGYRVIAGSGGNWQRTIDRARIDVRKFGARGDGATDCKAAIENAITWAASSSGVQAGYAGRWCIPLWLPTGIYKLSATPAIPGTNHHDVVITGEGAYTDMVATEYGSVYWNNPHSIGGTVLWSEAGNDIFKLEKLSGNAGSSYHRLHLKDLALLTSGNGYGINMAVPATSGDWQAGFVQLEDVIIAGAKVGWQIASYQPSWSRRVRIFGCETGLRLGAASPNPAGCFVHQIHGLWMGGCTDAAIEILKAASVNVYGGLLQGGISNLIKVPAGGGGRYNVFQGIYCESYDNWIECDPSVGELGITFRDWYLASGNGAIAPNGPVRIYGNGWCFEGLDLYAIDFEFQGGCFNGPFLNCAPRGLAPISGTGALLSCPIVHPTVLGRTTSLSPASGTVTIDRKTHGFKVELNVTGNVTLAAPVNYPPDSEIEIEVLQSGSGGYTLSFVGGWHRESAWSDAGNVGGSRAFLNVKVTYGGIARVLSFDQYRPV